MIWKEEEGSIYREYYKVMIECAMRYIHVHLGGRGNAECVMGMHLR